MSALARRDAQRATPRRRLRLAWPSAALACALVAFLNAAAWSIVLPAFQGPDEQDHVAYVQQLAETRSPPADQAETVYSPELRAALQGLRAPRIATEPELGVRWSAAHDAELQRRLGAGPGREGNGDAGVATKQPPLYYALAVVPYAAASGGTILDQLALMRLLSALLAGVTAFFAYLFVRETLPGAPWAWTVGGLGVALGPLLGSTSAIVNSDALTIALGSALLYCLARGFRRGLSPRLAVAVGLLIAAGVGTKFNFVSLVPGALLGVVAIGLRRHSGSLTQRLRLPALTVAVLAVPAALLVVVNAVVWKRPLDGFTTTLTGIAQDASRNGDPTIVGWFSYTWQYFLPRLPGIVDYFPLQEPWHDVWFRGLVGRYGWLETTFPSWVYDAALLPAAVILALAIVTAIRCRGALRARWPEAATYATLVAGLLVTITTASYGSYVAGLGNTGQARYLVPLIPLYAVILALAARAGGRRWGPAIGAGIVMLTLAHDLFSQLLVLSRYYG